MKDTDAAHKTALQEVAGGIERVCHKFNILLQTLRLMFYTRGGAKFLTMDHGCEITTQHVHEVRSEMARAVKGVEHAAKVAAERPLFWLHI